MPLLSPPPGQAGGFMAMRYSNAASGEQHSLRLHLAWFNPTAFGGDNDHAYVSGGPVTPSETFVSETYAAIAHLWQPYYDNTWNLECLSLGYNAGGIETLLQPGPTFPSYAGTAAPPAPGVWWVDRVLRLLGRTGVVRRLWLSQVPSTTLPALPFEVGVSSGGVDGRDRAWMSYLSGTGGGGAVMPDGTYCFPVTDMRIEWAREPTAIGTIPGMPESPYMVTG